MGEKAPPPAGSRSSQGSCWGGECAASHGVPPTRPLRQEGDAPLRAKAAGSGAGRRCLPPEGAGEGRGCSADLGLQGEPACSSGGRERQQPCRCPAGGHTAAGAELQEALERPQRHLSDSSGFIGGQTAEPKSGVLSERPKAFPWQGQAGPRGRWGSR